MKKIILKKSDIHKGNLILINQTYPLKNEFSNTLEPFSSKYSNILLNKEANKWLQAILKAIQSNEKIVPVSGYRSLFEQTEIYISSIEESGLDFTKQYVAYPNTSEHQTGLAIDLGLNQENIDFIRPSFPYQGICQEFRLKMSQYGFIERYKHDKENITNISAEEWHFRYVGYPHSEIMNQNNFCLEEYIDYLKQFDISNPLKFENYEIYYVAMEVEEESFSILDNEEITGNNVDGFIVTKKL
ncbi:MAG: M15 family metallopeptidase [Bacilli bacterium]|nr:M15 family metallopeptidase [Bacilli bacterium]